MKLKCEMRGFSDGSHYAAVKPGGSSEAIHHDAAAAHALMQAMDEVGPCEILKSRASELLREWGFDSGEVE